MTLHDAVVAKIFDECADFAERNGISEEDACIIAAQVGGALAVWPYASLVPVFSARGTQVYAQAWPIEIADQVETWVNYYSDHTASVVGDGSSGVAPVSVAGG